MEKNEKLHEDKESYRFIRDGDDRYISKDNHFCFGMDATRVFVEIPTTIVFRRKAVAVSEMCIFIFLYAEGNQ